MLTIKIDEGTKSLSDEQYAEKLAGKTEPNRIFAGTAHAQITDGTSKDGIYGLESCLITNVRIPPVALRPGATTADVADCYVVLAKRKLSNNV